VQICKKSVGVLGCIICLFLVFGSVLYSVVIDLRKHNVWQASVETSRRIDSFGHAVWAFYGLVDGKWPASLEQVKRYNDSFNADENDWWSTAYRYESYSNGCVISSAGPDQIFGTGDDIVTVFTNGDVVLSRRVGSVTNFGGAESRKQP